MIHKQFLIILERHLVSPKVFFFCNIKILLYAFNINGDHVATDIHVRPLPSAHI